LEKATDAAKKMVLAAKEVIPTSWSSLTAGLSRTSNGRYSMLHSGAVGYAAGSSGERLPTETAIIEVTKVCIRV
jgi:predicted TIM-barrel enzyme